MSPAFQENRWIGYHRPQPNAHIRLFCFPYAGGGATIYHPWFRLSTDIEIYPVQLPGRENRLHETPYTTLSCLVQDLAEAIQPYLDKPFAFFGHSMGGLISFALARQLRHHHNVSPVHVFVSAHRAPHLPNPHSLMHQLPETDFIQSLQRYNGIRTEVLQNYELMQLLLPLLRADFTLCETYTHQPDAPLACPISVFGGLVDQIVDQEALAAWQAQTASTFTLHMFPGNHFFLHEAQADMVQTIVQQLTMETGQTSGEGHERIYSY